MFNLMRLFRRADHIDDAASAYVEGHATERDEAELRERSVREPGLIEDLDSIRQTVSLLRSIEPVAAPRSFALAEAPVQVRVKRSRIAMAPAVFAIAAAAAVGLLAVGNLTDIVRQDSNASSQFTSTNSSADLVTAGGDSGFDSNETSAALAGPVGDAVGTGTIAPAIEQGSVADSDQQARAAATPAASAASPTLAPASAPGSSTSESLVPSSGGGAVTEETLPFMDSGAGPTPDSGDGSQALGLSAIDPGAGESQPVDKVATGPGTVEPVTKDLGAGEPLPLLQSTVTVPLDSQDRQELAVTEPSIGATVLEENDSGFALPLWQLQLVFASIAVLMAGAWFALQRRLTA